MFSLYFQDFVFITFSRFCEGSFRPKILKTEIDVKNNVAFFFIISEKISIAKENMKQTKHLLNFFGVQCHSFKFAKSLHSFFEDFFVCFHDHNILLETLTN